MSESSIEWPEIQACSTSLLHPDVCCFDGCSAEPQWAMIDPDMVEHARCDKHLDYALATKPLIWDPIWAPAP